jgi:hypothetical protein
MSVTFLRALPHKVWAATSNHIKFLGSRSEQGFLRTFLAAKYCTLYVLTDSFRLFAELIVSQGGL